MRPLRRRWSIVLVAAVLVLVLASCSDDGGDGPASSTHDPFPDSSFRIAALGDSYISGEGAGRYLEGTDEFNVHFRNRCHRAPTAHPFLVARQLEASMILIACSGARTWHVTGVDASGAVARPQYRRSREGVFGSRAQLADLPDATRELDGILISIGGNDAGFSAIGKECLMLPDCSVSSPWPQLLQTQVRPALERTYTAVEEAAPGVEVFALTYPSPLRPKRCDDLFPVSQVIGPEEWKFLTRFIRSLNETVRSAAAEAGIRVIGLDRALVGHRFCEAGAPAVNFVEFRLRPGEPLDLPSVDSPIQESLHPNVQGHKLMAKAVLPHLEALQAEQLPPPPEPDPGPPPADPEGVLPPTALPFPGGTACQGGELAGVLPVLASPGQREVALSGLRPGSTACFRVDEGKWKSAQVDPRGRVRVPIDVSRPENVNYILVQEAGGNWKQIVVSRAPAGA